MNTSKASLRSRLIGDKEFYRAALTIALPMMIQNAVSNFVNMLDNLMIGRVGTNALSGVAISNQLIFVYYLVIFGSVAGVGIFTAQYHGQGNIEGVRETFRFKLVLTSILTIVCILVLHFGADTLIGLFLKGEGDPADAAETLVIGKQYMDIMLIGLIPNMFTQAFSSTLREIGETKLPMKAVSCAVFVNLIGNFLLIYGMFGLPALGARGAAVATLISRVVEIGILVIATVTNAEKYPFIKGEFRKIGIPLSSAMKYLMKALPLMANETLWACGMTVLNQCYSYRSLSAVASMNIQSTLWNLLGVSFLAMGEAVGILVGHILGTGDAEKARDHARKLIVFTVFCGLVFGLLQVAIAPFFPMLYNTTEEVRRLATQFIMIYGFLMPAYAFTHASYFTIRSGGRTGITFIFDSCFVWVISVPTAYILSRYSPVGIVGLVLIVQSLEIVKCVIGGCLVHSGIWAKSIVKSE